MTQRITPRYMSIKGAALVGLTQGTTDAPQSIESVDNKLTVANYVWSSSALAWVVAPLSSTGGGGAGSTVSDVNLTSAGSTKLVGLVGVSGTVSVTGTTAVDATATLTSAGSTRLVGQVTVANPTTSVSLSSQITVTASGTTGVDANLTSAGSTKVVGSMTLTSAPSTNSVAAFTVANPTTSVTLAAGSSATLVGAVIAGTGGSTANTVGSVALLAGSTANMVGSITVGTAGSTANTVGSVALLAGSTGNTIGSAALIAGTTNNTVGSVALVAGSSANTVGAVAQGAGASSANNWINDGFSYSSNNTSRTSVSTTVDIAVVTASANTKGLIIANLSTSQVVGLGMSTAAVTTALGNVSLYLQPTSQVIFGYGGGGFPNYTGNIRGINLTSTTVAGGVAVTRFTNT